MMEDFGLNPDDVHEDNSTPIGIGNLCGNNVVRDRANDGANQVYTKKNYFSIFIYCTSNIFVSKIFFQCLKNKKFQYGDEGGVTYNRNPYSDYTDYQPVNTAYKVRLLKVNC